MSAEIGVFTRHIANIAGAVVEAVELQNRALETFEAMDGRVTVVVDDNAADVTLHDRGVTVHVRFDDDPPKSKDSLCSPSDLN